jgi:HD-GYP domain-containing protein (c-di-GMP phosphodiesterase class II)
LIHDIGKIKVSKITTQKRELSESEFREVRNHPLYSFEVLQSLGFETKDIIFVQQTHEKWDGMGYPYSIGGKEIQTFAQIIGIVELYNALLSPRPHREAFHLLNVMDKIRAEKNKSFGEEYVLFFEDEFRPYKKGMIVELNNGMFGKILEIKNKTPLFPIVMLYNQNTGEELQEVNLYREKELKITQVLNEYK